MLSQVIFYSFAVFTLINVLYISIYWKVIRIPSKTPSRSDKSVSVLVCAKNEEENLPGLLKGLRNQDYKNFDIILINDNSSDSTLEIMEQFQLDNPNVQVLDHKENQRFWRGKKLPLTLGIKRSKSEYLLFTDADCVIDSTSWISSMVSEFESGNNVVLGYGAYIKEKGFVNTLVRFETIQTALNYFSYSKVFTPYMGVGRNLAYTRELFFESKGFYGHMDVASGDDDLFINKNAKKESTAIAIGQNSWTYSYAPKTFEKWFRQKRRHLSASSYYSFKSKFLLGLQSLSTVLFYVLGLVSVIIFPHTFWVLGIIGFRLLYYQIVVGIGAKKLGSKDIIALVLFFEPILLILQATIVILNKFSTPRRWS